jgi:hypothetical protein
VVRPGALARPAAFTPAPPPPLVSVVVPVLDGERFLAEALDSILGQTYPRLEVLVMDDGSSDRTGAVAKSYGKRIAYHRQRRTKGIYANANDGIALAHGELIAIYHADDVYEREIVEREVAYMSAHPDVGAVFAADTFIDAAGQSLGSLVLPREVAGGRPLDYRALLEALLRHKNAFLRCPSAMVRAAVYDEVGCYDQDRFRNTADVEMWLRIARRHRLGVIDEHLWRYRRGHGSSSERYHALRTEPERFFRIIDRELDLGGRGVVSAAALTAYEVHRAEDQLKIAASHYILGRRDAGRAALADTSLRRIVTGPHPRRLHLTVFYCVMRLLLAARPVRPVANALRRRVYRTHAPASLGSAGRP